MKKLASALLVTNVGISCTLTETGGMFYGAAQLRCVASMEHRLSTQYYLDLEGLEIAWQPNTTYRFEIEGDFVKDEYNREFSSPLLEFNLTSNPIPYIVSTNPAFGSTTDNNAKLEIIFDHDIVMAAPVTKRLYLYKVAPGGNVLVRQWLVEEGTLVNNTLTFNTKGLMESGTNYYILMDSGIVKDLDNFSFPGISSPTIFTFTTAGQPAFPDLISLMMSSGTLTINAGKKITASASIQSIVSATADINKKAGSISPIIGNFSIVANNRRVKKSTVSMATTSTLSASSMKVKLASMSRNVVTTMSTTLTELILVNPASYLSTSGSSNFGNSVAVNGNYIVVGDYIADSGNGKVYVYNASTNALVRTITYPGSVGSTNPNFGFEIKITKSVMNYIIISAPGAQNMIGGTNYAGIFYVYNLDTGALVYEKKNNAIATSRLNTSIDITTTHFGMYYYAYNATGTSAVLYMYDINTGAQTLFDIGFYPVDSTSLCLTSSYYILSFCDYTSTAKVEVFDFSKTLIYTFTAPEYTYDTYQPDGTGLNYTVTSTTNYGTSVDTTGNYLIVGASGYIPGPDLNKVEQESYVYNLTTGSLVQTFRNPETNNPYTSFGYQVSFNGNHFIVTGTKYSNNQRVVFLFDMFSGQKTYELTIPVTYTNDDGDPITMFTPPLLSVDSNPDRIVVGIRDYNDGSGVGRVYIYNSP